MLTIDTREYRTNPSTRRYLLDTLEDEVESEQLESGDYAATDTPLTLGIEYKDFTDCYGSLLSNRLDIQCSKLLDTYDIPVLMIGEFPPIKGNGQLPVFGTKGKHVGYRWLKGVLSSWALRGVIVDRLRTPSEVGPAVLSWYETAKKKEHRDTYEPKRLLGNLRPLTLMEAILLQIPGVGPARAAAFRGMAPSDLAIMGLEDWVKRLGPITGMKAWSAWNNGK